MALPRPERQKPLKPSLFVRTLLKTLSAADLKATHFQCRRIGMERLDAEEPCLILMNHSSFIDLKIAATILYPRPFNIVCTSDGFVGKEWLMRHLGCIPTQKFVSDLSLVRDMRYAVNELHSSVLMFPPRWNISSLPKRLPLPMSARSMRCWQSVSPLTTSASSRSRRSALRSRFVPTA